MICDKNDLSALEKKVGYTFTDKNLLKTALCHSSYANENRNGTESNERLEFLGDSVLSAIVSEYLYKSFPQLREGDLSGIRREIVEGDSLSEFARRINLGDYILLGVGEAQNGGQGRDKILEDAFEAFVAALYLDGGAKTARDFLLPFIIEEFGKVRKTRKIPTDPKSLLQQLVQQSPDSVLEYKLVSESGPDHGKSFEYQVCVDGNAMGTGRGSSKKEAEKNAAADALEKYFPDAL